MDFAQNLNIARQILVGGFSEFPVGEIPDRRREIHTIEEIEKLATQLKATLLPQERKPEDAARGEIHVCEPGAVIRIAAKIAFCAKSWHWEVARSKDPLQEVRAAGLLSAAEGWHIRHIVIVAVGVEISGRIRSRCVHREGLSGLKGDDRG